MKITYPAVCHYEDGGYWCEFPDLEGCFSQGGTKKEIAENAREALEGYAKSILERGGCLPAATPLAQLQANGKSFAACISCEVFAAQAEFA